MIDAVTTELLSLEKIDRTSFLSWGAAWEKHPDLHARHTALYAERGLAQQARDLQDDAALRATLRAASRARRAKKCPTCGSRTLIAA